ncbi:hypothetical protein [Microbacterium elymi]
MPIAATCQPSPVPPSTRARYGYSGMNAHAFCVTSPAASTGSVVG